MQHLVSVVGLLGLIFTGIEEDIGTQSLFMEILASLTIRAVSGLVVLLAGLGLVLDVGQCLPFKLMSTVGKAALENCYLLRLLRIYLVSKLAGSFQFPILAHFGLVFSLIVLDELVSFLGGVELSSLGSHTISELDAKAPDLFLLNFELRT